VFCADWKWRPEAGDREYDSLRRRTNRERKIEKEERKMKGLRLSVGRSEERGMKVGIRRERERESERE